MIKVPAVCACVHIYCIMNLVELVFHSQYRLCRVLLLSVWLQTLQQDTVLSIIAISKPTELTLLCYHHNYLCIMQIGYCN